MIYDLRHTFATRAVRDKINLWALVKIMGHKDPQVHRALRPPQPGGHGRGYAGAPQNNG